MTHGLTEPGMEGRGTRRGAFRRRCTEARGQKNNTPSTLHGDGSQSRDFTYVDDIARGTVLAGKLFGSQLSTLNPQLRDPVAPTYNIINLGGGNNPLSITSLIAVTESALGKEAQLDLRPASTADMAASWAKISKAGRLFGWKPAITPVVGFN
jgi:UDP-glucuronate 4-epimerase